MFVSMMSAFTPGMSISGLSERSAAGSPDMRSAALNVE
jgi:hypothetical protein